MKKRKVGGICLNWGCIPTKALLESSHFFYKVKEQNLGLEFKAMPNINMDLIIDRSRKIAEKLSNGIQHLFKKYKVELIRGRAYINSVDEVHLFNEKNEIFDHLKAKNICIATGTKAKELPNLKFSKNVISYKEAMLLKKPPAGRKILVIGAGAIGCEFADFFCCLGAEVTLVEAADHILPLEEPFLAEDLKTAFTKKGITVLEKTGVEKLADQSTKVKATIQAIDKIKKTSAKEEGFDTVLLAVGVETNLSNLGLENVKAKIDKGRVQVNEFCQIEGAKNIFAIGDIIHGKQLAHKASHEGIIAAEKAAGKNPHPLDHSNVPSCTYTSPQVASVGLTAHELKEQNIPFKEGAFPFAASGKALAIGDTSGSLTSYVHENTGELLGAHYVGEDVTELISNFTLARSGELTFSEVLNTVFPHPTLAEMVPESLGQAVDSSVNF